MRSGLFLILVALFYSESHSELKKQPYLLYTGDNTQMKVMYQLNDSESCNIAWGTDSSSLAESMTTVEYGNDHQHGPLLTELNPGTKYFYTVSQGVSDYSGAFFTAPDTNESVVSFFAYGDTRTYPADHNTIAGLIVDEITADSSFQSLILSVGDLVHLGDNEADWSNQFFNPNYPNISKMLSNLPYQSCMGNHEQSGVLFKKYFPYPFVNGRYWSFDYGPAHFVVVDQYTSYSPGSSQLTWIENDLSSSSKPWKFIILHEPGWTAGGHENNSRVQDYLQPLCEQYRVQFVFGGHNHYYARAEVNDVSHITTGGGGAPLYTPIQSYPNIVTTAKAHHYCKIEIKDDLLHYSVVSEKGNIIDNLIINKYGIKPVNTILSSHFVAIESDSLLLLTELKNPEEHALKVQALIHGLESMYADTIDCFDDGFHGDGEADDGIWGNYIGPFPEEDKFTIDILAMDLDSSSGFVTSKLVHFTTTGPLVFDSITPVNTLFPSPGESFVFHITVRNASVTRSVPNVSVQITSDNDQIIANSLRKECGEIAPDTTGQAKYLRLTLDPFSLADSMRFTIGVNIFSEDIHYWTDSLSVMIYPVGIDQVENQTPAEYSLLQNYPNPFNPTTTIQYSLPEAEQVKLTIFDIRGHEIVTLNESEKPPGIYKVQWNGLDHSGSPVSTGVYFARLQAGSFSETIKMVYLR